MTEEMKAAFSAMRKFYLILATLLSFWLLNEVQLDPNASHVRDWLQTNSVADARSSGGRSRGGSFNRSTPSRSAPSPSRSRGNSGFGTRPSQSSPSRTNPSPSRSTGSTPSDSAPTRPTPTDTTPSRGNTGGRIRGGSFDRQPTPAPVPVTPSGSSNGTPYIPNSPPRQPNYSPGGRTVIVPVPVPLQRSPQPYYPAPSYDERLYQDSVDSGLKPAPVVPPTSQPGTMNPSVQQPVPTNPQSGYSSVQTRSSGGFPWGFVLFLLVAGGAVAAAWYVLSKRGGTTAATELSNDIVTVSKLQVALLASAREIQSHLTDLSLSADLDTAEGLTQLLQESALALLRHPDYWTHVDASSQTVKSREEAARLFEQLSIQERSKFSAETLTNVGGRVRYAQATRNSDDETASYIVVTLLIGTEDDKPLFDRVHSAEELQQLLQRVAAVTPDYLLVFELLWSPQEATDSLSYDELLMEYSEMIQIA